MRRGLHALGVLALAAAVGASTAGSSRTTGASLEAYRGLGTWVDIYDPSAWKAPEAGVRAMKARGVRTLYVETANYRQKKDLVYPRLLGRFIDAAHARGLKVVAWYLPSFGNQRRDYRRSIAAIRFRSASDQRFDSFALDIEASVVRNVALRNRRLLTLSRRIRAAVGTGYPLGAIIPSPRGMQLLRSYWPGFPYAALAKTYDVFLPMGYFSYRPTDLGGPYGYTVRNVSLIRRGTGNPNVPIHEIGGLAQYSSPGQIGAFVRATRVCGVLGASLYDFTTTKPTHWKRLSKVPAGELTAKTACA